MQQTFYLQSVIFYLSRVPKKTSQRYHFDDTSQYFIKANMSFQKISRRLKIYIFMHRAYFRNVMKNIIN